MPPRRVPAMGSVDPADAIRSSPTDREDWPTDRIDPCKRHAAEWLRKQVSADRGFNSRHQPNDAAGPLERPGRPAATRTARDPARRLIRDGYEAPGYQDLGHTGLGVRVTPREGYGIDLRDRFVGQAGEVPAEAPAHWGLAQRGSVIDPNTPPFDFPVNKRVEVWSDNIADLVEQAKLGQWNAATAIPWHELTPLAVEMEQAVCQICTFMIQNEYLALYLPAKLLTKVDPRFSEVVMFLASQVEDEARHVEVFTKRALANGGGLQYVSAATEWSLKSLLSQDDFTDASFLLHLLGEGTFMELLKFLEESPPIPSRR